MNERARDSHPLLFTATQLIRIGVEPIIKPNLFEQCLRMNSPIILRLRGTCEFERQNHIFQNCQSWDEIEKLEDNPDMPTTKEGALVFVQTSQIDFLIAFPNEHMTAAWSINAGDQVKQGALATARLTQQTDELARIKFLVHLIQYSAALPRFVVGFAQAI